MNNIRRKNQTSLKLQFSYHIVDNIIQKLDEDVEFINKQRLSRLSFGGHKKISRIERKSAIIAFSTEEVYAIAELLRRQNEINPKQKKKVFEEIQEISEKISDLEKKVYGSKSSKDLGSLYAKRGILYSQIDDFYSAENDFNESVFLFPEHETLQVWHQDQT